VALLRTDAIVLSALRYGETSKIVRLATREFGVQSAIARGALRPRSRFGAALQVLSRGQAHLLPARASDLHQLTAFDLLHLPLILGEVLERYGAALAMAEIMQRFAPADPHPELYDALQRGLEDLEASPPADAGVVGLRALWQVIALLGFEPALDQCVLDGRPIDPDAPVAFSIRDGGVLCPQCARTHAVSRLDPGDRRDLVALVSPDGGLPVLDPRHDTAHRRLLARFVHHQIGEGVELPALEFWQRRGWERAS
jgi:DNA repair protein RecO (recombination protein O)